MRSGSQADRIVDLLAQQPGLNDDEIAKMLAISPRQTVNQICRRLANLGLVLRVRGAHGKIVNLLSGTEERQLAPSGRPLPVQDPPAPLTPGNLTFSEVKLVPSDLAKTLFILPCSGAKKAYPQSSDIGNTIMRQLSDELARELESARRSVRSRIQFDERVLVPAWQRYNGALYCAGRHALASLREAGAHVLILSGGYGLVAADEPIGSYNAVLKPSWWPRDLLPRVLLAYARSAEISAVRAFAASTSSYRKLLERVTWSTVGITDALLFMPETEQGAMVRAPGTLGEALAALYSGALRATWRSSYGLGICISKS